MGNLIFGTIKIQGRTFKDLKVQTSRAGEPRPIIFGRARPIVGNIIATTPPKIIVKRERQSGGKGGPKTVVKNEEVFRTYAIRICEGPVTGISRVWRNNELVYDRDSTDLTQKGNNAEFLKIATFFLGSFNQPVSSVMQAAFGIANVHAYRGTCYMVINNENLTDNGGAIPQFSFEVERCEGWVLTSRPYSFEADDSLKVSNVRVSGGNFRAMIINSDSLESLSTNAINVVSGNFRALVYRHSQYREELQTNGISVVSGELKEIVVRHSQYREEFQTNGVVVTGGNHG